jgi:DNA-binding response OmpR family regulator
VKKATILSVDDDASLQIALSQYLEDDGYKVLTAANAADLEMQLAEPVDVILLDLILPDAEGLGLIAKIRSRTKAPIIIVSGKNDTTEKIIGLEMGADDYITKPFEMRELTARIKVVLRRVTEASPQEKPPAQTKPADIVSFDGWRLDRRQYQLFDKDGKSAELTAGEFRLLEALVLSPNHALTRDYLFELTREGEFETSDRAVDIQIGRIRKKMNDLSEIIKTVRGVGYMFCLETKSEQ